MLTTTITMTSKTVRMSQENATDLHHLKEENTSTTFINWFKSKMGLPLLLPRNTDNTNTQEDKKKDRYHQAHIWI